MSNLSSPTGGPAARRGRRWLLAVAVLGMGVAGSAATVRATSGTTAATTAASATTPAAGTVTQESGLAAAKANVEKYSTVPTALPQGTTPLKSKPEKKKIAFMVCPDPSCVELSTYLKQGTDALGWELTTFNWTFDAIGDAFQQAIDSGADYIAQTGVDVAQIPAQYEAAKAKGIPIFSCYGTDIPSGPTNGLYSNCLDAVSTVEYGRALADWVIVDSGGAANVLIVNLPAFPILTAGGNSATAGFKQDCPKCTVRNLDLTVEDLTGGAVANKIVTELQSHPETNYVYEVYEGFGAFGVPEAIAQSEFAGKVKIVGQQGFKIQMQNIIDGKEVAWSTLPYEFSMWSLVDQMARYSVGEWSVEEERALTTPFYLVTTKEQAQELVQYPYGWPGPAGYQDAFKKIWNVG